MGANAIVRGRVSDVEMMTSMPLIYKTLNWLRVFGNAEASRMGSGVGQQRSLNLSDFVARQIERRRGVSPRRYRADRLQRRAPFRCLLVPIDTSFDLLQTAIN